MGSAIFVSSSILHIRKQAFERKLQDLADHRRNHQPRSLALPFSRLKRRASKNSTASAMPPLNTIRRRQPLEQTIQGSSPAQLRVTNENREDSEDASDTDEPNVPSSRTRIRFAGDTNPPPMSGQGAGIYTRPSARNRVFSNTGVGAHSLYNHPRTTIPSTITHPPPILSEQLTEPKLNKYVDTLTGYIGRNSQFHNLSRGERKQLGGIEYDSVCLLSWLVPTYFILFQLVGAIGCGAWMQINRPNLAYENGNYASSV